MRIIAKDMGYEIVEKNASDVRNKSSLDSLLSHLTDNKVVTKSWQSWTNVNLSSAVIADLLIEICYTYG